MPKFKHLILNFLLKFKKITKFSPHNISTTQGRSDERYRRIILTSGSAVIVKIFSVIIMLITVPLTVNYLGAERYGLWMTISSVIALMSFADLGLGNGLVNAISHADGKGDTKEAQVDVSSTFFILLSVAFILFFIFLLTYPLIAWNKIFNAQTPIAIKESGPTMMVLVITFLINMPLGIIQRIQVGYQEGYKYQIWLILGSLLSLAGLLISIFLKAGLPWLVLAFSSGPIIATIANGINLFAKRRLYLMPKLKYFDFHVSKKLFKVGLVFFILGLFTLIANSSDNLVIAHTLGVKSVAGYEIVKKIFMFSMLTQFVIEPLWPAFGEAIQTRDYNWAKKTLTKALIYSISVGAILTLPLLFFGRQIITFWVGKEFTPSWLLLLGFYIYIIINNYIGVMSTFLNSGDLIRKQLMFIILTAITAVLLKVILSINFGVSGIIWATIIGWSMFYVLPAYYVTLNYFKNKIK